MELVKETSIDHHKEHHMTSAVAVITPAHRAAAFIRRGQRAWTAIKATAEEQRTLWLEWHSSVPFLPT